VVLLSLHIYHGFRQQLLSGADYTRVESGSLATSADRTSIGYLSISKTLYTFIFKTYTNGTGITY